MIDKCVNTVVGALLHDIGKVIYRERTDNRKHSISGYDFLKSEGNVKNKDILDGVRYHHAEHLKNADIDKDSIAYLIYMADNIASAADRREKQEPESGFDISVPLGSVFNILNKNSKKPQNLHYSPAILNIEGSINYPTDRTEKFDKEYYIRVMDNLKDNLKGVDTYDEGYINSLLDVLEANLTYVPSSTSNKELADISLYDHVKLTAAIALCIYYYLEERNITDYRNELFTNGKDFYSKEAFILYEMDVSGIQNFIYTISSENAMKMLRSRSFYLEIMMEHIIDCLLDRLGLARTNLIYSGGGHCYIIIPNTRKAINTVDEFNREVNSWFLKNFQTELYVGHGYCACSSDSLKNKPDGSYAKIFNSISNMINENKIKRYNASQIIELNNAKHKDYTRECKVCRHIGKVDDDGMCPVCSALKYLSTKILDEKYAFFTVVNKPEPNALILPLGYYLIAEKEEIVRKRQLKEDAALTRIYCKNKMYTGKNMATKIWVGNYNSECNTFEEMAKAALGVERIGVLRADVDNLGATFVSGFDNPDNNNRYVTLSRTATLSRHLSLFFKNYINNILKNGEYFIDDGKESTVRTKARNAVICYSGGDDLFIVGAWNEVIELAIDIKEKFERYTQNTLTISAGIGIYKHDYPISVIADEVADMESMSKRREGKNSVTIFEDGQTHIEHKSGDTTEISDGTYSWDTFIDNVIEEKYECLKQFFSTTPDRGMSFMYNLLELIRKQDDRINFARFVYLLARLEPDKSDEPEKRTAYKSFADNMYKWVRLENKSTDESNIRKLTKDGRQLKTAMNMYSYIIREREGEPDNQ